MSASATEPVILKENLLFMPGIYNETLRLLLAAHDYFYHRGVKDQNELSSRHKAIYASEMSRITMRLSCIMAWLLARKASLNSATAGHHYVMGYRLDCRDVCLVDNLEVYGLLPQFMRDLLKHSFQLYERVSRLDAQIPPSSLSDGDQATRLD